jgi:hypothetical protein
MNTRVTAGDTKGGSSRSFSAASFRHVQRTTGGRLQVQGCWRRDEFDLLNAVRQGKDLQTTTADEIMTKPAICVHEHEDVEGVIAKMTDENIIRLRVTGEDGRQEH